MRGITILSPMLLTIFGGLGWAMDPAQPASKFIRTSFGPEIVLPSPIIFALAQTRDGFLWLGTDLGLSRFDGRHFLVPEFSSPTLARLPTLALAVGPDGDLWSGTRGGVMRIPSAVLGQFNRIPSAVYHPGSGLSDFVNCLHFDRNGVLWAGTKKGLYRFERGVFSAVIPNEAIFTIEDSANGDLLLVTGRGFLEWDGAKVIEHPGLAKQLGVEEARIFHVFDDHLGVRWFCTGAGVARQTNGSIQRIGAHLHSSTSPAYRAYEDLQGNIWVSASEGVFRATDAGLEPVAPGVNSKVVLADVGGNLWLGTNGEGLIRFKDRVVQMFTKADGLPNNVTMTVLEASDGKLWVGNNCGGLSEFDGHHFKTYSEKDGLNNTCVRSLAEDRDHALWIGTDGGGIFRFRDGRFTQFSESQGLPSLTVREILSTRDGSLWIATTEGISRMQNGKFRSYTQADGLSGRTVINVYEDRAGAIWASSGKGVSRLDGERFVPFSKIPEVDYYLLLGADSLGGLYLTAPPKGIFRADKNRWVSVRSELTLGSMLPNNDLWFCAETLSRAAADGLQRWERERESPPDFTTIDSSDGFDSKQCTSGGFPSMVVTRDGKLWTATWQGLAMLDPRRIPPSNDRKPAIYLENVLVGRTQQASGRDLVLQPGPHHVELQFSSIELTSPEKIRFQYRMDGVDQEWLDAPANLTAIYSYFANGTHQFHVRACNRDGVWDRIGFAYTVTQQPYYYETNLFRVSLASVFLLILSGAYRLRLRQIASQMNARLDERVAERTRMARELHDTLLQTIQASSMMVFTAQQEVGNPDRVEKSLETLSTWLARAMEEARASLHSLRSSVTQSNNLAEALRLVGEECVKGGPLRFAFHAEGVGQELHPIVRDEIFQIGAEAIRNACNHSRGTELAVELTCGRDFALRVLDNGQGLDPGVASEGRPGHYGLQGMRERTARIGGKLSLRSSPESGTQVELIIPGRRAYRK